MKPPLLIYCGWYNYPTPEGMKSISGMEHLINGCIFLMAAILDPLGQDAWVCCHISLC